MLMRCGYCDGEVIPVKKFSVLVFVFWSIFGWVMAWGAWITAWGILAMFFPFKGFFAGVFWWWSILCGLIWGIIYVIYVARKPPTICPFCHKDARDRPGTGRGAPLGGDGGGAGFSGF